MSSSQGPNATTTSGYASSLRDSSDWIKYKRQNRTFINYKSTSTDNKNTEPVWLKYGNDFKLQYSFGRFNCQTPTCGGNAFSGAVGGQTII